MIFGFTVFKLLKVKTEMRGKSLYLRKVNSIFMDIQTRKLHFIQEVLALSNEKIMDKLESLLKSEKNKETKKSSIDKFAGILSDEDAKTFLEASEECRKVDVNEW